MNFFQGKKWHLRIAILSISFLLFHFVCTLIYTVPSLPVPDTSKEVSQRYMYPMFHQGWKLFAPDVPEDQYYLEYRRAVNGKWSDFEQGEVPVGEEHPRIPYMIQKLQVYLARDMKKFLYNDSASIRYDQVIDGAAYNRVLYFATKVQDIKYHQRPDSIQLRFSLLRSPEPFTADSTQARSFLFPPYSFVP